MSTAQDCGATVQVRRVNGVGRRAQHRHGRLQALGVRAAATAFVTTSSPVK